MEAKFLWKSVHLVQASFIQAHDKVTWVPELEEMPPQNLQSNISPNFRWPY